MAKNIGKMFMMKKILNLMSQKLFSKDHQN